MLDLNFQVVDAEAVALAATPQICFKLQIDTAESCRELPIESILLRIQLRIEPTRRGYQQVTTAPGLSELFGEPARWGATMRSMLWTHANVMVGAFSETTLVDVPIECSFDFNVAATKYFASLEEGDVPLCFLFSGTCFYRGERGLQAGQISWERESNFALSVRVWRDMMARYYPNGAWLCLDKDAFDALHEFKVRQALPTWEQAIRRLLATAGDSRSVEV